MAEAQQTSYLDLPDDQLGEPPVEAAEVIGEPAQEVAPEEATQVEAEESADTTDEVEETSEVVEATEDSEDKAEEEKSAAEVDYKAEYDRLTAPFKANGKDINVRSVDDAIALMQMGANYSKKMAGLKPHFKMLKMLEKAGLMEESKISYLIDLNGRNPEAIAKLVKDSGIDPLEMDTTKADEYKPKSYAIDDREVALDEVLDEIKDSPTYGRTINAVSSEWDEASKQVVANTPQLLKVINSHMETGIYDLIHKEVENEKLFGRLQGLSDIEAYRKVGDALQARGGFDHLAKGQRSPAVSKVIAPKPMQAQDDRLKDKKRAAAPSKSAVSGQVTKEFNPLALSDEEFSKLSKPSYL